MGRCGSWSAGDAIYGIRAVAVSLDASTDIGRPSPRLDRAGTRRDVAAAARSKLHLFTADGRADGAIAIPADGTPRRPINLPVPGPSAAHHPRCGQDGHQRHSALVRWARFRRWLRTGFSIAVITVLDRRERCSAPANRPCSKVLAKLAGYDAKPEAARGYRPVDSPRACSTPAAENWRRRSRRRGLPKITEGWFFRAESFFSVARYLDEAAIDSEACRWTSCPAPHGEGFPRFSRNAAKHRASGIFDEQESALSPTRQIEFLELLARMQASGRSQVIMATHSPMLMAMPGATHAEN